MIKNFEKAVARLMKQKICLIASVDAGGTPNIKAMLAPRKALGIKTYYFSTNMSSAHAAQFSANDKASVYFYAKFPVYKGVLLKGTMEVLCDREARETLWERGDERYYPGGVDDPDYCVMRFTAEEGRFYSKTVSQDFVIENDSTRLI